MSLKTDLEAEVAEVFRTRWSERDGQVVPQDTDLKLGNDGVNLDATVLYADLSDSTKLVDNFRPQFAAEMYKVFLRCATKIIISEGGAITAYDGDRVMGVFIGGSKNTNAVRAALKINYAVRNIIEPAKKKQYPNTAYVMRHVVGVDTSKLLVARAGIRGSNDLVWIGRAANYAAKLCALPDDYSTWITHSIFDNMNDSVKRTSDGALMWESRLWTPMNNFSIYRSNYWWTF